MLVCIGHTFLQLAFHMSQGLISAAGWRMTNGLWEQIIKGVDLGRSLKGIFGYSQVDKLWYRIELVKWATMIMVQSTHTRLIIRLVTSKAKSESKTYHFRWLLENSSLQEILNQLRFDFSKQERKTRFWGFSLLIQKAGWYTFHFVLNVSSTWIVIPV